MAALPVNFDSVRAARAAGEKYNSNIAEKAISDSRKEIIARGSQTYKEHAGVFRVVREARSYRYVPYPNKPSNLGPFYNRDKVSINNFISPILLPASHLPPISGNMSTPTIIATTSNPAISPSPTATGSGSSAEINLNKKNLAENAALRGVRQPADKEISISAAHFYSKSGFNKVLMPDIEAEDPETVKFLATIGYPILKFPRETTEWNEYMENLTNKMIKMSGSYENLKSSPEPDNSDIKDLKNKIRKTFLFMCYYHSQEVSLNFKFHNKILDKWKIENEDLKLKVLEKVNPEIKTFLLKALDDSESESERESASSSERGSGSESSSDSE